VSDRDELARDIGASLPDWTTVDRAFGINLPVLADAVWAAGWRKKPTKEELVYVLEDAPRFAEPADVAALILALLDGPTENGES